MTNQPPRDEPIRSLAVRLVQTASEPAFANAYAHAAVGTVFLSYVLRHVTGDGSIVGAVGALVVIGGGLLLARRHEINWLAAVPVTLIAFVAWCAVSIVWARHPVSTFAGSSYQIAIAFVALCVVLSRDLIQIVRACGDVLRVVLSISLLVEVFAGIIIDGPLPFLGVRGDLAFGGPIQGLFGSRNALGLVAIIALMTFAAELTTRSVTRPRAIFSVSLAVATLLLTRSPVTTVTILTCALMGAALYAIRRVPRERRRLAQLIAAGLAVLTVFAIYIGRARVLETVNGTTELQLRLNLWRATWNLISLEFLQGWGWTGAWHNADLPYSAIRRIDSFAPTTALNAYLDTWLQVGLIGFIAFCALVAAALLRAWLAASDKRSPIYAWPLGVLAAIAVTSAGESFALVDFAWFLLALCAIRAALTLSWRTALIER